MTGPMVQGGLRDGHMTIPLLFAPPSSGDIHPPGSCENVAVRYNDPQQGGTFWGFRKAV